MARIPDGSFPYLLSDVKVARYNPETGEIGELQPLPEPRIDIPDADENNVYVFTMPTFSIRLTWASGFFVSLYLWHKYRQTLN